MDFIKPKQYKTIFAENELRSKISFPSNPKDTMNPFCKLLIAGIYIQFSGLWLKKGIPVKSFDDFLQLPSFPDIKYLYTCLVLLEDELGVIKLQVLIRDYVFSNHKNYPIISLTQKKHKKLKQIINTFESYLSPEARQHLGIRTKNTKIRKPSSILDKKTLFDMYKDERLQATFQYLKNTELIVWKHNFKVVINEFPNMRWYKELESVNTFKHNKIYRHIERYCKVMDILVSIVGEESLEEAISKIEVNKERKIYYSFQEFLKLIVKIENSVSPNGFNQDIANIVQRQENQLKKDAASEKIEIQAIHSPKDNEQTIMHPKKTKDSVMSNLAKSSTNQHQSNFQQEKPITNKKTTSNQNLSAVKKESLKVTIEPKEFVSLGTDEPNRIERKVITTQRNQSLSQKLKLLYGHRCQVCGEKIQIGINEYLSESHHIQPVGGNHQGPDIADNIIIVCPNHHAMFDRGAITIDLKRKIIIHIDKTNAIHNAALLLKHEIKEIYVSYHDKFIYKGETSPIDRIIEKEQLNYECIITIEDSDGEQHEFTLPNKYNKYLMKNVEKVLLHMKEGNVIKYKGFDYMVKKIEKIKNM